MGLRLERAAPSTTMKQQRGTLNHYHVGDARHLHDLLGEAKIDVTITSPPYWDLKDYGSSKQIGFGQAYEEYMSELVSVFDDVWTRTNPQGSLWIVLDSIKKKGKVFLLPFDLAQRLTSRAVTRWHLQDVLVWHKLHTLPWSHNAKLQGHFEYILCLSKTKNLRLNLDGIRTTNGLESYRERRRPNSLNQATSAC